MLFKNLKGSLKVYRETHRKGKSVLGVSLPSHILRDKWCVCPGFTSLECSWMSFRCGGEGTCTDFLIVFKPHTHFGQLQAPQTDPGSLAEYSCRIEISHTRFWNLLKHQHILLVIKHQLKKHPKIGMSPELLLATSREPACPDENYCPQKAKEKQGKVEIWDGAYIRGNTISSHPRTCPLWELHLEAEGTRSSSVFVLRQGIKRRVTTSSPAFALTQWFKPARSVWVISVCSSTSELALLALSSF